MEQKGNVFKQAQTHNRFTWDSLGDIRKGRENLGEEMSVLVYRLLEFTMLDVLVKELGEEKAHELFRKAGFLAGRELAVGIGASQIISNVPATLLLADFTHNLKNLTIGVNLGGLGTLIASMASLISYKIYAHNYNKTKGRYLLWFTIANVLFLAVLVLVYVFIS